ncbi:FecR family protein [Dyadobacter chenhuakuii]|uniref:FecR domain-containing protein n=1 Tax=Dyadobacter chenhuakuii TaxID=2909339 RepID=A0ABY4XQZ8_9BACT|nr:FecR domain-containing protein [Dyadobacter chenhuakuii]MCF2492837.1 FecR domain-containing protein [Dyadobacter chenhuakuii]USJ32873.1 FecR domain-containing protein [Dyadobacter chenhuakuii]
MSLISKPLLFEHFAGRTSVLQKKLIEEWLQTAANQDLFYAWLAEWEMTFPVYDPRMEEPLARFDQYMQEPQKVHSIPAAFEDKKTFTGYRYLAAAVFLALITFAGFINRDQIRYQRYSTDLGKMKEITLSDGSRVTLNANAVLRVPRWTFGVSDRNVFLEGEAEFAIKHLPDHQLFQVHTMDNSLITVLGTEFTVHAREQLTNVVLNKGKVRLSSAAAEKPRTMQPGERATIVKSGEIKVEMLSEKELAAEMAWKEHRFVFDNTPLSAVARKIREVFGVEVHIPDKGLALRTATGSFPAESAEELLTNMSVMYGFEIVKTKKQFLINPIP